MAQATPSTAKPAKSAATAPAPRAARRPSTVAVLWHSTVGKKTVMAVTGVLMLLFLVAHMAGNLKVFFGPDDFNGYAHWLRTIGEPVLHYAWFLWIMRVGLVACVVLHGVAAAQLSRRDLAARPTGYVHSRPRASYATRTMRWGGVILALFIVWHLLDMTTLTVNPLGEQGHPYQNVVADFRNWYADVIYIVAMLAVGLHIRHGFWSAAQTLGVNGRRRDRALKVCANVLALVLTAGFIAVPVSVMTKVVS
ncbi:MULTISPECIES: succinate dehydrogenase cytochrome b subunit [Streptomycetaceae]|nr:MULTISPECIES: succinate dehydrogenase cytochrome b subunit [Streptomycetaceae]MYS61890.1 succinate dehydrogenase [Streptomyces sp. SID5468]CCB77774.1 putative cytochrome b subunit [Streptantibioticus cattleyicolor NRRL 8057 = DSM 46488]